MEHLRADYTEVWVPSVVTGLIRFAEVRAIAATGIDSLGLPGVVPPAALIARLGQFDSIVSWYGSNREEFRDAVRELGLPFQFFAALPERGAKIHAADFFLKQAGGGGCAVPRIECEQGGRGDFAVIHPFSGSARKNWPLEQFREVARKLAIPVRWCAGPEEPLPPELTSDAVRFENLYELGCWFGGARVYIGNDSGITHLAAAVGTPVIAVFGPSDPVVWAPRGERVRVVSGGSLDQIAADDVLEAARQIRAG